MELADNEKSKKLLKLLEQKSKIEERRRKVVEQILIEEERIGLKLGKMTRGRKKQYQQMKKAYNMRQEGLTFMEIGKSVDLSASQVSKLCQRYSVLKELLEEQQNK